MSLTPWDLPAPPADHERRFVPPIAANDLQRLTRDEGAGVSFGFDRYDYYDIENGLIDRYRQRRPSLARGIIVWISDTFSGPRGFVWFAGTLFPIAAAAFAIGYFGWELTR